MKPLFFLFLLLSLSACASKFPNPDASPFITQHPDELTGNELFGMTLAAHGGDHLQDLSDVSVGITGKWKQLIRRIQPLVTDFTYRVDSQERLLPKERVYAAAYAGPAGNKYVFRTPDDIRVQYNATPSFETEVLSSTALTADAFHLFLLGPLALADWRGQFQRIADKPFNGKPHYRVHLERAPGFGFAEQDQVVLWIDPQTRLTRAVQITLLGHESTRVAHVEVEYLRYIKRSHYTFPSAFFERVNAPIAIDAHAWQLTGLRINSGYTADDLAQPGFTGAASKTVRFPPSKP